MAGELIAENGNIILAAHKMEAYIPIELFDEDRSTTDVTHAAVASTYGEGFRVIAIFSVRIAKTEKDDISKMPLKTYNYPQLIETYPSSSYDAELTLPGSIEPQKYRVFVYEKGDIVQSQNIVRNADNCTKFMDVLIKGKLPNTLKYEEVFKAWIRNFEINDINPGIPYMYLQFIISELYRVNGKPSEYFRMIYGKDMTRNDYAPTNMRGSVATSSVFTGQTFEHMGRMLTTGITMTRNGTKQKRSPIEDILSM